MVEETKRTIAFLCPSCRQPVVVDRTVFSIAAGASSIPCPCGKSTLELDLVRDKIQLQVPCMLCERTHTVSCSMQAFLKERTLAFACAASGLDCCYVGEEGAVFAAMTRLEETLDKLEAAAGAEGTFLDEIIMEEILAELRDIAARGKIFCTCGGSKWNLRINFSSIDVECASCSAALRIPASTAEDLEDLCCKDALVIRGKRQE